MQISFVSNEPILIDFRIVVPYTGLEHGEAQRYDGVYHICQNHRSEQLVDFSYETETYHKWKKVSTVRIIKQRT